MFPTPQRVNGEYFGDVEYKVLEHYIKENIDHLWYLNQGIRETLMPRWIRTYKGTPASEERSFPWPGASNLIIQVAATQADELLSRIMSIYTVDPLFVAKLLSQDDTGELEDERAIIEEFLQECALEPEELDLYRVEETFWASAIRYGTGIIHFPWETVTEKCYAYIAGDTGAVGKGTYRLDDITKRDGPHPENISLNLFGIDTKASTLANAKGYYIVQQKNIYQIQQMLNHPDVYIKEAVEKILTWPDRNSPDRVQEAKDEQKKPEASSEKPADQWDIYQFWFKYQKPGSTDIFNLIAYYHKQSETHLGCIFNPYPENIQPTEDAKLAYDDDTYHGYGFMEMGDAYQREVSAIHNWRMDNRQFATTGIGRVNKNSKLASILQIYPGILIPADKDEVEWFQQNSNAMAMGTEDEELTLRLFNQRTGVDPAEGGGGGGVVNAKRGIYSAQGTAAVMQLKNNRNNLRLSDMRSSHVRVGRKVTRLYAEFGLGTKIEKWGNRAQLLQKALADYKNKKLGLIIKPATASSNKELEKQNDILMSQTLDKLYGSVAQLMVQMGQQGVDPAIKNFFAETIKAQLAFGKHMLRNFAYDDVGRLLPIPDFLKEEKNARLSGGQPAAASQNAPATQPVQGNVPVGGGQSVGTVPR